MSRNAARAATEILTTCPALAGTAAGQPACGEWTRHPDADFNADGQINTLDVLAFLNAWSAGC